MNGQLTYATPKRVWKYGSKFIFWRDAAGGFGFRFLGLSIARLHRKLPIEWHFFGLVAGYGRHVSFFSMKFVNARTNSIEEYYARVYPVSRGTEEGRGNSVGRKP